MEAKAKLDSPLWVRISKENHNWIKREAKRLGYSKSEFVNLMISNYIALHQVGKSR